MKHIPSSTPHVTIVGGGIAGASAAYACATRGMSVLLLERHSHVATEASGNPAGILYPFMAKKWDAATLFYLQGFSHTIGLLPQFASLGARFDLCGMQHYPKDGRIATLQQIPHSLELSSDIAVATDYGFYMPHSGWVDVPSVVQAMLTHPNITVQPYADALSVSYLNKTWVINIGGASLYTDTLIVANAYEAATLFPKHTLPMRRIRGQITYLPAHYITTPQQAVLCYGGYLTPPINTLRHDKEHKVCYVGATFDQGRTDIEVDAAGHNANLTLLQKHFPHLLPEIPNGELLQGRVAFRTVSGDRLPIVGELHDEVTLRNIMATRAYGGRVAKEITVPYLPHCYVTLAHGARGMVSAPLAGEILAATIANDVKTDVKATDKVYEMLAPARFALRAWRKGTLL